MAVTIQTRRDDAADWATANPVLALGEIGIETDTDKAKYGDGFTLWNDLEYWIENRNVLPDGTNQCVDAGGVVRAVHEDPWVFTDHLHSAVHLHVGQPGHRFLIVNLEAARLEQIQHA